MATAVREREAKPTVLVADVGLDSRVAGSEAVYTYSAGPDARVGQARYVPLGPRDALGYVLAVRDADPDSLGFPVTALKPLGAPVEGLDLPDATVRLVHEVARQTLVPLSVALGLAAPPGVKDRLAKTWSLVAGHETEGLTPAQAEVVKVLQEKGRIVEAKSRAIPLGVKRSLSALAKRGIVVHRTALVPLFSRAKSDGLFRLTPDTERVERFLATSGKRKPAQAVTVMRLQGSEASSLSAHEIKALAGVTEQTISALVSAGLLEPVVEEQERLTVPPEPNEQQAAAISALTEAVRARSGERFLLFGVTGSGKTEVYLQAAAEALKWGRQVLYLVPEIALTAQVIGQLRGRFGRGVAVVHSMMSPGERLENWVRIRSGEAAIVLGARSAVFSPIPNLGLIIVDEEHESSYKQENTPRYQTKALATFLAKESGAPVVFGSATPSMESFQAAKQGDLHLLTLPNRAASASLPAVDVEDLTESYKKGRASIFSPVLAEALQSTLAKGEQAILFLNRRAYSPFLLCRDCGHRFTCRQCAVSLAYHRRDRRLRCHHCGHQEPAPDVCPACQGERVAPFGVGAEKVEEAVKNDFPNAAVARLDRDVARRKGALEEVLTAFRSGETNVLVGTQMVAKGLDFPRVTLVGVIAADISLNIPDFRASERSFQLLSQVAGRAGRGERAGRVIIQTLDPAHPAVQFAATHDYEAFFGEVIEERRLANYPPFCRLVNIVVSGASRGEVAQASNEIASRVRSALPNASTLGPADCPIERVQGLWRRHALVKLQPGGDPSPVLAATSGIATKTLRVSVDVDPSSLM